MIEREEFQPFTIRTRAGRSYRIADRSNVWLPGDYDETACISVRGKGILLLAIEAIDAVQFEHDTASSR